MSKTTKKQPSRSLKRIVEQDLFDLTIPQKDNDYPSEGIEFFLEPPNQDSICEICHEEFTDLSRSEVLCFDCYYNLQTLFMWSGMV